ncbi:MAG: hypothetical protein AAF224_09640 [Pseudomonadota bacterium]
MARKTRKDRLDDRFGGYVTSFIAFSVITGLWAFIVRGDVFYGTTPLFGFQIPAATIAYLTTMPLFGFIAGRWRYEAPETGFGVGKSLARGLNFVYSHLLIVLFTTAMVVQAFFGLNIDATVEAIDDSLFDVASRFAPWLAAYLAGFNLGRASGLLGARTREAAEARANRRSGRLFEDADVSDERDAFSNAAAGAPKGPEDIEKNRTDNRYDAERNAAEPFAFKRDPALFDADGNRRAAPAPNEPTLTASRDAAPASREAPAGKPAALLSRRAADGAALEVASTSFERLR